MATTSIPEHAGRRSCRVGRGAGIALAAAVVFAATVGPAAASHETPWEATVNGAPFHGDTDPHLEGCTLDVAIEGLSDGEHVISVAVDLTDPHDAVRLATDGATVDATSWSASFPLDQAVAGIEPHANGYHLRVTAVVDGTSDTSRPFWLACGQQTTGNPFRVTFDVVWRDHEGTVLGGPPASLDRGTYRLEATSTRGRASCAYSAGGQDLVCTYANTHGHDDELDALIVPGGQHHTFSVAQTPLPEGWSNESGLGTFSPREVCPDGDHDHDDDHDGHDAFAPPVRHEHGTRPPCPMVVTNVGPPPPSTTTTTTRPSTSTTAPPAASASTTAPPAATTSTTAPPAATAPPATSASTAAPPAGVAATGAGPSSAPSAAPSAAAPHAAPTPATNTTQQLPATGSANTSVLLAGLASLALGTAASIAARRFGTERPGP